MADVLTAVRRHSRKAARKLEELCHDLWVTEGKASFAAGNGANAEAERFAGDLACILVDRLLPAVEALKRLAEPRPTESPSEG